MTTAPSAARSCLAEYDRALIGDTIDTVEQVAAEIGSRPRQAGQLIDAAARLRTVLIWERPPG